MPTTWDIKLGKALLWVVFYLGIMLFYTFLDVAVWRKFFSKYASILNILTISVCITGFLALLRKTGYRIHLFSNLSLTGIALAVGCSLLFFLLLDKGLDPILGHLFPQSEKAYQEMIQALIKSPITSLLQVCVLAPITEEILMRGFVLGGLRASYGSMAALLISAVLFAVLHFNMVQTLSSFLCGVVLGLLYLQTGSIFCCIIAHCGYNLISFLAIVRLHI